MYNNITDNKPDNSADTEEAVPTLNISQENETKSAAENTGSQQDDTAHIINEDAQDFENFSHSFENDSRFLNFFTRSYEQIYMEESFYELLFKYAGIIVLILFTWAVTGFISSVSARCMFSLVMICIFGVLPRIFYIRYYRVYKNNEIKKDYTPHSFTDRLIYSTKRNLSSMFMFLMSGIILFFILVTHAKNGGLVFLQSFILFALLNSTFNIPGFSRLMKADKKETFFRFNRRFIVCLICGIAGFATGCFLYAPSLSQEEARNILFGSFNSDYHNNLFTIFIQGLNYVVALVDYILYSLADSAWYTPVKSVLIGMPMGVFSAHVAIIIGMLTMPWSEFKMIYSKQEWVKQRKCFLVRNWKTIMLPLFMTVFLAGAYVFGYPRYIQYLEMAKMNNNTQMKVEAELIGGIKYKIGTLKEIRDIKTGAIRDLHQLMSTVSTEINKHFDDLNDSAEHFVNWYKARNSQYPFIAGDSQLKQSFISSMSIKNLDNSLNNMRKDIARYAEEILVNTRISIDDVLKNNVLSEEESKQKLKLGQNVEPDSLYELDTGTGREIYLKDDLRQQVSIPSAESILIKEFDNPDSPWFNNTASKSMQSIEDQLFGIKEGKAPETPNEEKEAEIEDNLLKHLISMLYSCKETIAESVANSLNMPLEDIQKTSKGRPVNNAIINTEAESSAEEIIEDQD